MHYCVHGPHLCIYLVCVSMDDRGMLSRAGSLLLNLRAQSARMQLIA